MKPNEKLDASIKLAEFGAKRWDVRRDYEWKITLAVWAVLAAAVVQLRVKALPDWWGLSLIILYAVVWSRNVFLANHTDKLMSDFYRKYAETLVGQKYSAPHAWRLTDFVNSRTWS